jgi:mannose-6-phosphate isomerase
MSRETQLVHVPKPWGREVVWAANEHYAGKILFIRAGNRLSVQYHEKKDETLFLMGGKAYLFFQNGESEDLEKIEMSPEHSYRIKPNQIHSLLAETDCIVVEASTPHLSDVVRLQDLYNRPTKSIS